MPLDPAATWEERTSLTPWNRNPRRNDAAIDEVAASIRRFGFASPIVARRADRVVIAGHTRLAAAEKLGLDKVPVRFLDLDPDQAAALALADNKLGEIAEWDDEALAGILQELDGASFDLSGLGWEEEELAAFLEQGESAGEGAASEPALSDAYTDKIKAPIYEPTGEQPAVVDLFNNDKTAQLLERIDAQEGLPAEVAAFLRLAAMRHTVFHFRRIAEYYAHAPADVQDLFEQSALVIIDFERAIEEGFVHMSAEIAALVGKEKSGTAGSRPSQPPLLEQPKKVVAGEIIALATKTGMKKAQAERLISSWNPTGAMFARWYDSLKKGSPDYSVYSEPSYIGEAWACWIEYSRKYLRAVDSAKATEQGSISQRLQHCDRIVDLGCGIGLTTAALSQMFPSAAVYGTNISGSTQFEICSALSARYGFQIISDPAAAGAAGHTAVFAFEYFEHFKEPIKHLNDIIKALKPSAILTANTFNSEAIGHFPSYLVNGRTLTGKQTSRAFGDELRRLGYQKIKTKMWNARPSFWLRGGEDA